MCVSRNLPGVWIVIIWITGSSSDVVAKGIIAIRSAVVFSPILINNVPDLWPQVKEDGREIRINDGFLIKGRAVLIPDASGNTDRTLLHAWIQDGKTMIHAPGLPPHEVREDNMGVRWIVRGIARLNDGSEVLIWDGEGYEWDGEKFQHTFTLGLTDPYDDLSAVPVGQDGFFFIHKRKLYEAHRGKKTKRRGARAWTNIMSMMPGPEHGLLLKEGDNDDGDIGKLYFPTEETFIHLEPELFNDQDRMSFLCWSQGANRIIASDSFNLHAISVEEALSLPRFSARTGEETR